MKYNYKTNIMFECQLGVIENIKLGEYEVENKFLNIEKPKFPISVNIVDTKDGISVRLVYNSALYTENTIKNYLDSIVKVVETMAETPLEFIDKIRPIVTTYQRLFCTHGVIFTQCKHLCEHTQQCGLLRTILPCNHRQL